MAEPQPPLLAVMPEPRSFRRRQGVSPDTLVARGAGNVNSGARQ